MLLGLRREQAWSWARIWVRVEATSWSNDRRLGRTSRHSGIGQSAQRVEDGLGHSSRPRGGIHGGVHGPSVSDSVHLVTQVVPDQRRLEIRHPTFESPFACALLIDSGLKCSDFGVQFGIGGREIFELGLSSDYAVSL